MISRRFQHAPISTVSDQRSPPVSAQQSHHTALTMQPRQRPASAHQGDMKTKERSAPVVRARSQSTSRRGQGYSEIAEASHSRAKSTLSGSLTTQITQTASLAEHAVPPSLSIPKERQHPASRTVTLPYSPVSRPSPHLATGTTPSTRQVVNMSHDSGRDVDEGSALQNPQPEHLMPRWSTPGSPHKDAAADIGAPDTPSSPTVQALSQPPIAPGQPGISRIPTRAHSSAGMHEASRRYGEPPSPMTKAEEGLALLKAEIGQLVCFYGECWRSFTDSSSGNKSISISNSSSMPLQHTKGRCQGQTWRSRPLPPIYRPTPTT